MADINASIRPFRAQDDKLVRFTVGKASMESLATANHRATIHPLSLATWLLISYTIVKYMNLWPTATHGILGYLRPAPVLAASFVPIMFLMDWLNRPEFEQMTQDILRGPDMTDIQKYYAQSPASGFWLFEYDRLFVGFIALDTTSESPPGVSPSIPPGKKRKDGGRSETRVVSPTAIIRHFYVDEAYRSTGIQEDLLAYALRVAFNTNPTVQSVKISVSPLMPYLEICLQKAGFTHGDLKQKVGVFGWQISERVLSREDWEKKSN